MPSSLEIKDIQTLSDLHASLGRFAHGIQRELRAVESQVQQALEWLDERVGHWHREVERTTRMVQQAQADLSRCESSDYRDQDGHYHQPDCSRELAALQRAEEALRLSQQNLQTAQVWRSRVGQSADAYSREAHRLQRVATSHTDRARAELRSLQRKYEAVHQAQLAAGIAAAIAGGVAAVGMRTARRQNANTPEVGIDDVEPSTKYEKGGYEFQTDEHGHLRFAYGNLHLGSARRNPTIQNAVGRLGRVTDEGGHLIGVRFGGPSDAYNLVPQNANLNRSAWKEMENGWANALRAGHEVRAIIEPVWGSSRTRPTAFQVIYQIDMGNPRYVFYRNRPS